MRKIISVIGSGSCPAEDYQRALITGRLLAEAGFAVLTGGLGGIMEGACRGASEAGGLTIGILPGLIRAEANPYVEIVLTSGLSEARNLVVATSPRAVIAIGGGLGTLAEIAFALRHGVPVIGLSTWDLPAHRIPGEKIHPVESPEEAVRLVRKLTGGETTGGKKK